MKNNYPFCHGGIYFFCLSLCMSIAKGQCLAFCPWCGALWGQCLLLEGEALGPAEAELLILGVCCLNISSPGFSCQYLKTMFCWRDAICNSQKSNSWMCQFLPEVVQESLSHLGKQSLLPGPGLCWLQLWPWKMLGYWRTWHRWLLGNVLGFQVLGALFFQD